MKRETAADGTVMSLVPLPDGGFAYVAADPAIGAYSAGLERVLDRRSNTADFRASASTFGVRISALP